MKKILKHSLLTLLTCFLLSQAAPVFAAIGIDQELRPEYAPQGYSEIYNEGAAPEEQFSARSVTYIIADIAVVLLQITGALAVYFIISNGFTLVRAMGNEETIAGAKKGIMWALIGLIVVLLSYAIVQNVLRVTLSLDEAALNAPEAPAE